MPVIIKVTDSTRDDVVGVAGSDLHPETRHINMSLSRTGGGQGGDDGRTTLNLPRWFV